MKTQTLSLADCHKILGVPNGADLDVVKHAYRKRAFELHPDLNPGDGASRKFQQLNEAYVILIRLLDGAVGKNRASGQTKASPKNARQAYEEQARQERENNEAAQRERRGRQEREQQEKQEQARCERERREQEEREHHETERRERLKQEIERQESERLARQAQARRDKERQTEARIAAEKARDKKLREETWRQEQGPRAESYRRSYARPQPRTTENTSPKGASQNGPTTESAASNYGTPDRETLLDDLLHDPFARRVYEDIYSEVQNRKKAPSAPPASRSPLLDWSGKASDLTGGIGHAIKGWLRGQIDEEQELFFPASKMFPGARFRLQIRRGFSGELCTVDITLPPDFAVGKPVRLKGMGRKIGRWQGDLYLTFQIKE